MKAILAIFIVLFLLAFTGLVIQHHQNNKIFLYSDEQRWDLTKFINDNNIVYVHAPECSHCIEQNRRLYIDMIKNGVDIHLYQLPYNLGNLTIEGTPAWIYHNNVFYGEINLSQMQKEVNRINGK